jgi:hypothetical protein
MLLNHTEFIFAKGEVLTINAAPPASPSPPPPPSPPPLPPPPPAGAYTRRIFSPT